MLIYQDLHTPTATYTFRLYPVGTDFSRIGGIYCFLTLRQAQGDGASSAFYSLLYLGLTNNFDYRLKHHHKMGAALELGMTHIGVLKMRSGRRRKMAERDLLRSLNPPLNETFQVRG